MEKEKLGKIAVIVLYFILGAASFIAAGVFLHMGIAGESSAKFMQAGIFVIIGSFWMIIFGERRNSLYEDYDDFLGGGFEDSPEDFR